MSSLPNHKEKISSCPREKGWLEGDFCQYEGFWYHEHTLQGIMAAQDNFEAKSSDIVLASNIKTGTTWLQALAFASATRNAFFGSPLLTKMPHGCVPFLEIKDPGKSSAECNSEIPLIGTHISYTSLPKSIREPGCKIVYIWRDAKDVFASLWHFFNNIHKSKNSCEEFMPVEEAFERFCTGVLPDGPYWDHVLGYWNAKLEFLDKILFLKYEEMKEDTKFYAKQLAEFVGYPFSLEEEENGVVEEIISMCSFDNLRNLEVNKAGTYRLDTVISRDNNLFFRKGEIGDWRSLRHQKWELG